MNKHLWLWLERLVFVVAILVAVAAWWSERDNLKLEYVRLAVSILHDPAQPKELRVWAVQLLQDSSPVPLPPETAEALTQGKVTLPQSTWVYDPEDKRIRRAPAGDGKN